MKAQLVKALENEGIIVDKRWGIDRLRQEAEANGIPVPDEPGAPEPEPEPEPEIVAKAAPEKPGIVTCIALVDQLHIDKRHLVGVNDDGMSKVFALKERFELAEPLARSLEAQGCVVVVK